MRSLIEVQLQLQLHSHLHVLGPCLSLCPHTRAVLDAFHSLPCVCSVGVGGWDGYGGGQKTPRAANTHSACAPGREPSCNPHPRYDTWITGSDVNTLFCYGLVSRMDSWQCLGSLIMYIFPCMFTPSLHPSVHPLPPTPATPPPQLPHYRPCVQGRRLLHHHRGRGHVPRWQPHHPRRGHPPVLP